MNHASVKRLVALCLALTLAFSGLLSTACKSGVTPTTPSEGASGTQPTGTPIIRIISANSDSIEVEGVDPALGGSFRLRIEGMQSERPIYYVNGALVGELFDTSKLGTTRATNRSQESQRGSVAPMAVPAYVLSALAAALTAWSVVQLVDACGTQIYFAKENGTLSAETWESCVLTVVLSIAGKLVGVFKALGLGKIIDEIIAAIDRVMTWTRLGPLLNRVFKNAEELREYLRDLLFEKLWSELKALYEKLAGEEPFGSNPNTGPRSFSGTFTAVGTFTLHSCAYQIVDDFKDVRLTLPPDGTPGYMWASLRTTVGPKISGPSECVYSVSQDRTTYAFLTVMATGESWRFEAVRGAPAGQDNVIFDGTATPTSAKGIYSRTNTGLQVGGEFSLSSSR